MKIINQSGSLPLRAQSFSNLQTIDLKWNNISVVLSEKNKKSKSKIVDPLIEEQQNEKYILQNVSGYAVAGQLTAILGPSGAGKTTLVALLSKRYKPNDNIKVEGQCLANNVDYDRFTDFGAFVMQDDLLMATLTVKETLQFAANLRLKGNQLEKVQRVSQLIKDLHLQQCQNTYVGDRMLKGISGGEKKRTSIGVELVSDPPVIILDEPTSGLDSYTAFICMNILKKIALKYQRTVLFTIHQPSTDISALFDRVIILNNGNVVYQGHANQLLGYCEQVGLQINAYQNPLDSIMNNLNPIYNHEHSVVTYENYQRYLEPEVSQFTPPVTGFKIRQTQSTFAEEFKYLFQRAKINFIRSPTLLRAKIMAAIFLSLFIGTLYWNIGGDMPPTSPETTTQIILQKYLQNMNGACTISGTGALFSALHPMMMLFPVERQIFLKEENTKMYKTLPYFLTKILVEIPSNITISVVLAFIYYYAFHFIWETVRVFEFILVTITVSLTGNGIGIFTGCLFPDPKRAVHLGPIIIMPLQLFGGQMVNLKSLAPFVSWVQYISPFKYFLEANGRTQLEGTEFTIVTETPKGIVQTIIEPMEYYGRTFGLWNCIYVLMAISIGFHILAAIFLRLLVKKLNV